MLKFSVLMSVYKKEKPEYLKQAIESMVNQTLMPCEIVIVKDGLLTNELDQVIDYYYKMYNGLFKIVTFEENRGLGLALHDGVVACSCDVIARMDTDDIARLDRFEKQMAYLEQNQEVVLLGSWITEFSRDPKKSDTLTKLPCYHEEIMDYAKRRNPFRHMTVIFKKKAILDSGNYRDFLWFEDYDLWVRVLQKGYKAANLPEILVNVRADREMFARRGGWKYLRQDVRFQHYLFNSGFISPCRYCCNTVIRIFTRLLPNSIRKYIYINYLRTRK